jgi:hypothetical protein
MTKPQLALALGLFCMNSPLYTRGIGRAGMCFAMYSAVCFVFSWIVSMTGAGIAWAFRWYLAG